MTQRRSTPALIAFGLLAATLAGCSSSSTPEASADCGILDPVSATARPLTDATKMALETNDFAGAAISDRTATLELMRDTNGNYALEVSNIPMESSKNVEALRLVENELFLRRYPDTTTKSSEWVSYGLTSANDPSLFDIGAIMDMVIIGSESTVPGLYQLDDTLSSSFANWQTWEREDGMVAGDCEYDFKNTDDAVVSVHLDAQGRVTRFYYANTQAHATLKVSYDPVVIEKPSPVSSITPEEAVNQALDQATIEELTVLGGTIDRGLRAMAAMTNLAPNSGSVITDLARSGDLPTGVSIDAISDTGVRTTIWDGTAASGAAPQITTWLEISSASGKVCVTLSQTVSEVSTVKPSACTW